MKYGIKSNIHIPGEIKTKEELFRVIRQLTSAGYFFEITNFYRGQSSRPVYMVQILGHKND